MASVGKFKIKGYKKYRLKFKVYTRRGLLDFCVRWGLYGVGEGDLVGDEDFDGI